MAGYREAIEAALYGPENKRIQIYGHDFNVKKFSVHSGTDQNGKQFFAHGKISHKIGGLPDDQIRVEIDINTDRDVPIIVTLMIEHGGIGEAVGGIVGALLTSIDPLLGGATAPIITAIVSELEGWDAGSWEVACKRLCAAIAVALRAALAAKEIPVEPPPVGGHHVPHPHEHEH